MPSHFNAIIEQSGVDFSLEYPPFEVGDRVVLIYAYDSHLQDCAGKEGTVVECRPYATVLTNVLKWRVFVDFGNVVCPVMMAHNVLDMR
jgi:hypothetical protein